MSKLDLLQTICPKCGKKQSFEAYSSINVTLHPELKEKLLDGSIFRFKCVDCQEEASILYPCLYHDMEKKLMIQLCPPYQIQDYINFLEEFTANFNNQFKEVKALNEDYKYRIVTNLDDFYEKIYIFEAGLDDRVIELIKLNNITDISEDYAVEKMLFSLQDECKFLLLSEGKIVDTTNVLEDEYKSFEEIYNNKFKDIDNTKYCIDESWAIDLFAKSGESN